MNFGSPEAASDPQSESSLETFTVVTLTIAETQQGDTRWFNVKDDELPTRIGVYEGSSHGIPGFDDNAFHHLFYRWNGERFSGSGGTPEEAARSSSIAFPVAHWRGLLANGGVPGSTLRRHLHQRTALLVTQQHLDVRVEHLVVDGLVARFRFTAEAFKPCSMEGQTRRNNMGWYISAKLRVRGLRSRQPVYGAVVFAVDKQEGRRFLYGVWKQDDEDDKTFSSELSEAA